MALSEQSKLRKKEYNQEYNKKTGYAAQSKYHKEHAKQIIFKLFSPQDDEMIAWIDEQPNKSGYIKDLIRADMKRKKK
jgi:hypothetical protein